MRVTLRVNGSARDVEVAPADTLRSLGTAKGRAIGTAVQASALANESK